MQDFKEFERPEVPPGFSIASHAVLVAGNNQLAFDLWKQVRAAGEIGVISPGSLTLALAMVWVGARGETALEIARTLHLEGQEGIHHAVARVLRDWNDPDRETYVLSVVNRLFGEQSYPFKRAYLDFVQQRYGAPLEPVDFRHAPELSRERINRWVEAQTSNRIRDVLPPGIVSEDTGMVLANAMYFRGQWSNPFESEETVPAAFHPEAGGTIRVPTMRQEDDFAYAETDGVQLLEMEYRPGRLAMTIVLPSRRDGLGELERRISASLFDSWRRRLGTQRVVVSLPRFRIEPSVPMALGSTLSAMGMPRVFDPQLADFTAIAEPENAEQRLVLVEVVQKTFIQVDEKGTEAAAATALPMSCGARLARRPLPKRFIADHPFLFVIRDTAGGMILFLGRVANPESEN